MAEFVAQWLPRHSVMRLGRGARLLLGLALLIPGSVLFVLALSLVQNAVWASVLALAGLALAFKGLDRTLNALRPGIDTGFWLCTLWLAVLVLAAIFADLLPLSDYDDPAKSILVPGYASPNVFSSHPLGTDGLSLDILARCIYGARVSLLTTAVAVAVSLVVGVPIGTFAAYRKGSSDRIISVLNDTLLSVPALLLLIALASVLGHPDSLAGAAVKEGLGLALVTIPTTLRLARASALKLASADFVFAARVLGAGSTRIVLRELIPSVVLSVVSYSFLLAASLMVAEGSLSYLGLGMQQPHPTWGNMMASGGLNDLSQHAFVVLFPGLFLFLTVFGLNRVGERARARWGGT